jgi:hypothetical protein
LAFIFSRKGAKAQRNFESLNGHCAFANLDKHMIFASLKFFLFLVRRNSASFASPHPRKSFAAHRLALGGEAKLSEFRLGGVTKLFLGV